MNKTILIFGTAVLFAAGSTTFTGCNNNSEQHHENGEAHEHHEDHDGHNNEAAYQCPMQCEGDKTYEKAGKCPSCGMDLEEVNKDHSHSHDKEHGHDHDEHGHDH